MAVAALLPALLGLAPDVVDNPGMVVVQAISGLLLGSVYPVAMGVFLGDLNEDERLNGMAIVTAFGSCGAAAGLFVYEFGANLIGEFGMRMLFICLAAVTMSCWYAFVSVLKTESWDISGI